MSNQELTKQLYKPNIKIINYFTDMQLISKFQKGFRFILCVIDIYIYIYIHIYIYKYSIRLFAVISLSAKVLNW